MRGIPKDYTGQRFGRLTAVRPTGGRAGHNRIWEMLCDCGVAVEVSSGHLGTTKSCGCFHRDKITSHGLSKSPEYKVWSSMIDRCHNPNNKKFKNYGERGIVVCSQWRASFSAFIKDMGRRPKPRLTIERNDNNGNYEKANCEWATYQKNNSNRRYLGRRKHKRGPYMKKEVCG